MKKYKYNTPISSIWIGEEDEQIVKISFSEIDGEMIETPLIKITYNQLCEYFAGERKVFDFPLKLSGTPFQIEVWKAVMKIPYGKTASYKDIACKIGNPKASRAVGMANNRNNLLIIVPCHRILASNGNLTGYVAGLDAKKYLLDLEKFYS